MKLGESKSIRRNIMITESLMPKSTSFEQLKILLMYNLLSHPHNCTNVLFVTIKLNTKPEKYKQKRKKQKFPIK